MDLGTPGAEWRDGYFAARVTAAYQLTTPAVFSALPACSGGNEGLVKSVSDSSTNTWGATITGSGSNHVQAYCNGTNWTVAAK
jgi:hypothetical protein